jgi:hypothetical protein
MDQRWSCTEASECGGNGNRCVVLTAGEVGFCTCKDKTMTGPRCTRPSMGRVTGVRMIDEKSVAPRHRDPAETAGAAADDAISSGESGMFSLNAERKQFAIQPLSPKIKRIVITFKKDGLANGAVIKATFFIFSY